MNIEPTYGIDVRLPEAIRQAKKDIASDLSKLLFGELYTALGSDRHNFKHLLSSPYDDNSKLYPYLTLNSEGDRKVTINGYYGIQNETDIRLFQINVTPQQVTVTPRANPEGVLNRVISIDEWVGELVDMTRRNTSVPHVIAPYDESDVIAIILRELPAVVRKYTQEQRAKLNAFYLAAPSQT